MYSYEIEEYLKQKNYLLSDKEILFITDIRLHPQISRITYNCKFNFYEMYTYDNWYFKFGAKPYVRKLEKP